MRFLVTGAAGFIGYHLCERLLARGLTAAQAEQRIAAQMPLEEKRKRADVQIDCSGTLEHTREQARALAARLKEISQQKGTRS